VFTQVSDFAMVQYENLPEDKKLALFDILAYDYFIKMAKYPAEDPPTGTFMISHIGESTYVSVTDDYQPLPQAELLAVDMAAVNEFKKARKEKRDFKKTPINLSLTNLVLLQQIKPEITNLDEAFAFLRPLVRAAAANPANQPYL
jgi:hypothetical protein